MALKNYTASADTTIVNVFQPDLATRGTGANMGAADVVEVFSIYGRVTTSSQELSRALIKFPTTKIAADRTAGTIPASGDVSFYLKMFNAEHSRTIPRDITFMIRPISQDWEEGVGLDLETYADETKGSSGANWMSASKNTAWTGSTLSSVSDVTNRSVGGSYLTSAGDPVFKVTLPSGLEDIDVDISSLVEKWIAGTINNYGVGIYLSSSLEASASSLANTNDAAVLPLTGGAQTSYYTKRFFARGTQYFFKRPTIQARWDSTVKDSRGDVYFSSSLAPPADNMNTLYFYNYIRGKLTNIPSLGTDNRVYASIFSGSANNSAPSGSALVLSPDNSGYVRSAEPTVITGGLVTTGIYSASFALTGTTSITTLYDVWFTGSDTMIATSSTTQYFTGSFFPQVVNPAQTVSKPTYYLNVTNLRGKYRADETARFNLYIRNKNWSPTIYTVANSTPDSTTIVSASYRVFRTMDAYGAVPYGTGSDLHTHMSYDVSGNYFDFDMILLEPGYEYAFKFAFYDSALNSWSEQPGAFKFRVEDYEY